MQRLEQKILNDVFDAVRTERLTRKEIAQTTGLKEATVRKALTYLAAQELVFEAGVKPTGKKGRPATRYTAMVDPNRPGLVVR